MEDSPHAQEVALYASWLGSMVEVAMRTGTVGAEHSQMLKVRRAEGNQVLFQASGELGEPARSYIARLIAIEDILSSLPVK